MKLDIAFKEWATICTALGTGRQSLILRKGGISEVGGAFLPEHSSFWLYPTFFHQQIQRTRSLGNGFLPLLQAPNPGWVPIQYLAEVQQIFYCKDLDRLLELKEFYFWTTQTVEERFNYRCQGLYLLLTRIKRLPEPILISEEPEYAGCKSWVTLKDKIVIERTSNVLSDEEYHPVAARISEVLGRS
ncbi:DUF1802 family protein [Telmatocola sphagniphila]|uniref:DUF1802 family protein n=1 Tax=Telmatocola sphagniphila TaxID=1123043 RepID=A0A8E6B980_9BACT|nr:DUF1802 family protein [Telmatocola sphagniphila]QVL33624.1 DUF1802 family protein [Telmatocola sphagniphila]